MNNFVLLLQALKQTLGSSYSVSVAIGSGDWRTNLSYDIPSIFANCDFVNLMSYDLHGGWESKTGIHAGLYQSALDPTSANVDYSVNLLLKKGVAREKLIMGIPAYGNKFQLANSNNNKVGAAATGSGSWKFYEICSRVNSGSLTYVWDDAQKVPYAFRANDWVGYDDVRSVTEKANYIKNLNLGGAMFWSLDSDDYNNACGYGRFPLISTVYNIVIGGSSVIFLDLIVLKEFSKKAISRIPRQNLLRQPRNLRPLMHLQQNRPLKLSFVPRMEFSKILKTVLNSTTALLEQQI